MPIPLVVAGTTYNYPIPGEDPGWGEDGTAWAQAVTSVLNNLFGPGDILETTSSILDNQVLPADVTNLLFSSSVTRAANVDYVVTRVAPSNATQSGILFINFDVASSTWQLTQTTEGHAGISFSILATGQVQYTSSSLGSAGIIKFKARTLSA